jgi:hypothetical protein
MPAPGLTSTKATGEAATLIVAVAVFPSTVQLATALPALIAVTVPSEPIVATLGSELVHERVLETETSRESNALQLSFEPAPSSSDVVAGLTWMFAATPPPTTPFGAP